MLNFDWLSGVSIETAKWIFLSLFIAIGVVVCFIPSDYVFEVVEKRRCWLHGWAITASTISCQR